LHNPVVAPVKRGKARHVGKREGPPPFFTPEQFDQLCRAIEADAILKHLSDGNRWLLDFIRFAAGTGLRRAEIIFLRWDAIDLEARMIRVRNTEEFSTKS